MQGVEICNALCRQVNDLGVNYQRRTKACRFLHDPRKALRPIISVHRVEAHATIPHMNLQAVAIVLEFVQPVWPAGRALGDDWLTWMNKDWLTWMNKTGRHIDWPPAWVTRHGFGLQSPSRNFNGSSNSIRLYRLF